MLNIGPPELLLVLAIALIVVGPQTLPELARTIGRGLREFRKVQDEVKDMVKLDLGDETRQTTPSYAPPPTRAARPPSAGVPRHPTRPSAAADEDPTAPTQLR